MLLFVLFALLVRARGMEGGMMQVEKEAMEQRLCDLWWAVQRDNDDGD